MNKEFKCNNVVYFDYSVNDVIDIMIKYSDELLSIIPSSPFHKIWELSLSKNVLESSKNYYNNNYYNKKYLNEYIEILAEKCNQIHYIISTINDPLIVLPLIDEYITKNTIIDDQLKEKFMEKIKMFLIKDSEVRRQSISLEDYWIKSLDMLKNTEEGRDIINYVCVDLFNDFQYTEDILTYLPSEEELCSKFDCYSDPLNDNCKDEEERQLAMDIVNNNIERYKQTIEMIDNFLSTILKEV